MYLNKNSLKLNISKKPEAYGGLQLYSRARQQLPGGHKRNGLTEHYDVTLKRAFSILDIKYHQFIILYTYTFFAVSEKIWQKVFGDLS